MKSFTQRWREASDEAEDQPMEDTPTDPKEAPCINPEPFNLPQPELPKPDLQQNLSMRLPYKTILSLREQIEELKRDNYEVRRERDQAIELRNQRTAELDAVRKEREENEKHVNRLFLNMSERLEVALSQRDAAQAKCAELEKLIQDAGHEECCPSEFGEECTCWKSRLTPAPPEEKRP